MIWLQGLLGGSGGVVNSPDFYPAAFTSSAYFLHNDNEGGDSEFAKFILPTLEAFLRAHS